MPIFNRPLVTDRPTVVEPVFGNDEGDKEEQEVQEEDVIETLGDGGDKIVHGLEVGKEHEEIVKASNLVAILATGEEGGKLYSDVFKNAAFQLLQVDDNGHTLDGLVHLSEGLEVAYLGMEPVDVPEEDEELEPAVEEVVVEESETDEEEDEQEEVSDEEVENEETSEE